MSLIECPECGNQISSHAEACPNCGYSFKRENRKNMFWDYACLGFCIIGLLCDQFLPVVIRSFFSLIFFNLGFFTSYKSYNNVVRFIAVLLSVLGVIGCVAEFAFYIMKAMR